MSDKKCAVCDWVGQLRRGYCKRHYRRFMKTGDPLMETNTKGMTPKQKLLFWGWDEVPNAVLGTPCWEYKGLKRRDYGAVSIGGKQKVATRVAYEVWVGPIPDGMVMMHLCDNPPCINPLHLSPGTTSQNAIDMVARGRANPPMGRKNGQAKLADEQVIEIRKERQRGVSVAELAVRYSVSKSLVYMILRGTRWKHLPNETG